jgi:hypothetical protein
MQQGRNRWPGRQNRRTRHFCAIRLFFLINLPNASGISMLSCKVGGIFPQRQILVGRPHAQALPHI